eukprot:11892-Heterococcus_DN1.PRE.2
MSAALPAMRCSFQFDFLLRRRSDPACTSSTREPDSKMALYNVELKEQYRTYAWAEVRLRKKPLPNTNIGHHALKGARGRKHIERPIAIAIVARCITAFNVRQRQWHATPAVSVGEINIDRLSLIWCNMNCSQLLSSMLHASAWLTVLLHLTKTACGIRLVTDKKKVDQSNDHIVVDATAVAVALKPGEVIGLYRLNEKVAALGLKSRHEATCYAFRAPEFLSSTAATTVPDSSSTAALSSELLSVDSSSAQAGGLSLQLHEAYRLGGKFDGGSHGEIWRAKRVNGDQTTTYVLKRMLLEKGDYVLQAGLREIHFGEFISNSQSAHSHIARYVEHFYRYSTASSSGATNMAHNELWLVFHEEGYSLKQYMYTEVQAQEFVIYGQSELWRQLRLDRGGAIVMKQLLYQLIQGVADLHAAGITHRDIKPSNLIVRVASSSSIDGIRQAPFLNIADFSSAIDETALRNGLYGINGPSQSENTIEYAPPEVLFSKDKLPYAIGSPNSYDIWSIGVVFLELILGTPQV